MRNHSLAIINEAAVLYLVCFRESPAGPIFGYGLRMYNLNIRTMKTITILTTCLLLVAGASLAQNTEKISDEDLRKYAITMDSVEAMQNALRDLVAERVRSNTVMPVERYNELFKIIDDTTKLRATQATPDEIAFIREIDDLRSVNIERINEVYQELARDFVGAKTFNTIHRSLKSDTQLKSRFEAISEQLSDAGSEPDKGG
jgi:hypothetical protein